MNDESVYLQDQGRDTYFYALAQSGVYGRNRNMPKSLALYYDVSASAQSRDFEKETALLRDYLLRMNNPYVRVVLFGNKVLEIRDFSDRDSNRLFENIKNYLGSQVYDGASDLNIDFAGFVQADEAIANGACDDIISDISMFF